MFLDTPLSDVIDFVNEISSTDSTIDDNKINLSKIQSKFISFCITSMVVLGNLCWDKMQRASFGAFKSKALGWMLHYSLIPWLKLWEASVIRIIKIAGLKGVLIIDDSDRIRAKGTWILFGLFKTKDKKTSGYVMAQNIVLLVFVTKYLTIPVGFKFFRPDPKWKEWREKDLELRKEKKLKKSERPKKPGRDPNYPMRTTITVELLQNFKNLIPEAIITTVVADAAYLTTELVRGTEKIYPDTQIISQICKTSLVSDGKKEKRNKSRSAEKYFENKTPVEEEISLRGMSPKKIKMLSARLYVHSKKRKFHIIALKYDKETEYRYLAATKLSWRAIDIIRAYAIRWLIEVVIEDWKVYDGWGKMAFQRGEDGARRGVILSFLVDHFLTSHALQLKQLKENKSIFTSGSLCRYFQSKVILAGVKTILQAPEPMLKLQSLMDNIENVVDFRLSDKHMSGHNIGEFEESPSLKQRYKNAS